MKSLILLAASFLALTGCAIGGPSQPEYQLVILNGRVIDPETGLDAVRNLGVQDGKITRITKQVVSGQQSIDARGLVVAPGFIDLHAHGQSLLAGRVQAMDGVTTALELEAGVYPVDSFYQAAEQSGRAIHYGAAVDWARARQAVLTGQQPDSHTSPILGGADGTDWRHTPASDEQTVQVLERVQQGLDQGAIGIGALLGYIPGSGRMEYYAMNQLASQNGVPSFTHARYLSNMEPDSSMEGIEEMIAVSAATGAQMHVSHLNSISMRDIDHIRPMLEAAQARGVDISVEAYPYGAGSTAIGAALFEGENWQERLGGIKKSHFTLDGVALSDAEFDRLQEQAPDTTIVVHILHPDARPGDQALLDLSLLYPGAAIASDGGGWLMEGKLVADNTWPLPDKAESHPRSAGTFSRFLREYVRERQVLSLPEALERMTVVPARILQRSTPQMRYKGRLQVGADADIVVFNPETVGDRATYDEPAQTSVGFEHVIVAGTPLVLHGQLDTTVRPGQAVRRQPSTQASKPSTTPKP